MNCFVTARLATEKADFRPALLLHSSAGFLPEKIMSYWEKLRDPRWQRKRLKIMECADFSCEVCGDDSNILNVHHKKYRKGADPWEYDDHELMCLCSDCHSKYHGYKKAIEEELATCELFELPWIHALLVGFRGGVIAGDGIPSDSVTNEIFDDCEDAYKIGLFADALRNLTKSEVERLQKLFNTLNPSGFSEWVEKSIKEISGDK